jgi:hypothetical protein
VEHNTASLKKRIQDELTQESHAKLSGSSPMCSELTQRILKRAEYLHARARESKPGDLKLSDQFTLESRVGDTWLSYLATFGFVSARTGSEGAFKLGEGTEETTPPVHQSSGCAHMKGATLVWRPLAGKRSPCRRPPSWCRGSQA